MQLTPKKILFIILAIFIIGIFWRFLKLLSFPDSSVVLEKGDLVKVQEGEEISQKFEANRDGMSGMEILLRSPGIRFEKGEKVAAKILDENCQDVLISGFLEKSFFDSQNLYRFSFLPMENSAEKKYCFEVSPDKKNSKSIQIFTLGENENRSLSIRPVYKNKNVFQDLSELNRRISQYKPFFLKHYYLWSISLSFIILSLSLVIILVVL